MTRTKCRRADCRRFRVSPELAAVIVAADRVADTDSRQLLVWWRNGRQDGPELVRLREAVQKARAAAEKRDGYKPKKKDVAL